jgi:hypothetical protein
VLKFKLTVESCHVLTWVTSDFSSLKFTWFSCWISIETSFLQELNYTNNNTPFSKWFLIFSIIEFVFNTQFYDL